MSESPSSGFTISTSRIPETSAAINLYDSVGWGAYTQQLDLFEPMLTAASHVITAWTHGDELAGLARVVGDGVTIAVVQDLIVHPRFQGHGLGTELLRCALEATASIRQTYITTDADPANAHVVALYESLGFTPSTQLGLTTLALFR